MPRWKFLFCRSPGSGPVNNHGTFQTLTAALGRVGLSSALAIALCAGCSSKHVEGRKEVFSAQGKLLVNNQPAAGAMFVLHPVNSAGQAERPYGKVGLDGSFTLTTYEAQDGAPVGEYVVTAEWRVSADKNAPGPWPNVLPPKYGDPKQSDLRVTIAPGTNDLQALQIVPVRR
jgi:hypothetical protein